MKLKLTIEIDPKDLAEFLKLVPVPETAPVLEIPVDTETPVIIQEPEETIPEEQIPEVPIQDPVQEPVIVPDVPIQVGDTYRDITEMFYERIKKESVSEIYLSGADIYRIDTLRKSAPGRLLKIWSEKQCSVLAGIENYDPTKQFQDGHLFDLTGGTELFSDNINWCNPKQTRSTQPQLPSLFRSVQDAKARWTAVIRNCDTTALGRNGGFGIGFVYGGIHENHIGLINFKHIGPGLIDGKNPYENGVLYLTMQDVDADFSNKTEFGSNHLKVTGYVKDNIFTITSDHTLDFLFNNFFVSDKNDNRATILHIGRYTFMLDDIEAVINPKQIKLRPMASGSCLFEVTGEKMYCVGKEIHVFDRVDGAKVIEKDRDNHPFWSNDHNPLLSDISYTPYIKLEKNKNLLGRFSLDVQSSWDQEGIEQEAFLIYKANDSFRTTPQTTFGDPKNWNKILSGEAVGHQWYIHAGATGITLDARRLKSTGFYRQTQHGAGKSLGFNMVDCQGFKDENGKWKDEFNPYNLTEIDRPLHERVAKYL